MSGWVVGGLLEMVASRLACQWVARNCGRGVGRGVRGRCDFAMGGRSQVGWEEVAEER